MRCIYSVAEVVFFRPRGFDCVSATSGPIMIRRFGHSPLGPRCRTVRRPYARRTRLNASRSPRLRFAINGERRLPSIMEQSIHGRTPKGFVATDATSTLSLQSSRATIEAQILLQRMRNASAIVRAHQKFLRHHPTDHASQLTHVESGSTPATDSHDLSPFGQEPSSKGRSLYESTPPTPSSQRQQASGAGSWITKVYSKGCAAVKLCPTVHC